MTNFLAIEDVTKELQRILQAGLGQDLPNDEIAVKVQPPDTISMGSVGILNLFLYQVTRNSGYSNIDLPARNANGELISKPLLGVDLHYLMTAYSSTNKDDYLQDQRIIASALRILHEKPVLLSRNEIISHNEIALVKQQGSIRPESIRLTHEPLSMEEMTKLWSSFPETKYRISIGYQATLVLLEGKQEPITTLPVKERLVYALPFRQPMIDKVDPQIVERRENARLTVRGRNLKSDIVSVQFEDLDPQTPQPDDVTDEYISIIIPLALVAGIKTVRVIHNLMLGSPKVGHKGFESNIVPFVLAPLITKINNEDIPRPDPVVVNRNEELTLKFEPAVTPEQRTTILIGNQTFSLSRRDPASDPVKELSVTIPADFPGGESLVRLRIDGAESLLEYRNNEFIGPKIEVADPPRR